MPPIGVVFRMTLIFVISLTINSPEEKVSKLYDGKREMNHREEKHFEIIPLDDGRGRILSAIVHSPSLKRNVGLCILESADKKVRKLNCQEWNSSKSKTDFVRSFSVRKIKLENWFSFNKLLEGVLV